ncbi:ParB/RepB/Spo0J family partition protein [Asticcacaulis sp. 201]|uniref:ParB/RepB/Spo0J family partition protein n=1 Tax=Asticcacaulis sp. 201 TaxID=3028787 RepID=UPI00291680FA|nr:ParB/RepB/Spo0J family partition protein [Asticcacaulis sp. 201]MDV6330934.1 ParB/RepB/Spo0J family partition protein [Asticcacaulis sp. 201]
MSKKQSDYLSSLLGSDATPPSPTPAPAPTPSAPRPTAPAEAGARPAAMNLLARDSALSRVASGEVRQVTQLLLDPARVRIWHGNARHQASLTEDTVRDLIDAILSEGGQKVPAIIRRVQDDPKYDYEVIAGSRRHWAISWLRANNYPDMMFLAQVHSLDDEAAFRLSDIENRARKDVSDFERAKTYVEALRLHYNGKQVRMAERLKLSEGWLSKMLSVGALPDWCVNAFASPADIQLKTVYPLAKRIQTALIAEPELVKAMKAVAAKLSADQAQARANGKTAVLAIDVVKQLMDAGSDVETTEPFIKFDAPSGRTALSVLSSNRNGVSVRVHAGSGATEAELVAMFRSALHAVEKQGRGQRG